MRIITDKNIDQISSMNNGAKISDLEEINTSDVIKTQTKPVVDKRCYMLSVEELKQQQGDKMEKTIQSSIIDINKEQEELEDEEDEEALLQALEQLENPSLVSEKDNI